MRNLIYILHFSLIVVASGADATREVTSAKLVPLVAEALSKSFELDQGELILEPTRAINSIPIPTDTASVSIELVAQPYTQPTAFMKAHYRVLADGKAMGEQVNFFKARLMRNVWVTHKIAQRGKNLGEIKLLNKKTDTINLRGSIWTGKPDESQQLVTTVSAGSIILERHLRRTPVIFRNQTVDAVLQHKALEIRLRVLALEDGAPGDLIRLRNTRSSKELRGKVVNNREVKVTY
ncbi:MAG TPA: flagella basal body P-ring formation protein FlgA [Verrucomicrobiales bacterium]|nr:flagella basal body P-ring formation protein FlgA [Verrucomicrobiales bacterium]|tara:strand:+ start:30 stop:737 length:708 start_codon:yes stop_codon:yes gene_type:complete